MPLEFFNPVSNITPFTYRDGETYLEQLRRLRAWIDEVALLSNAQAQDIINQFDAGMATALANLLAAQQAADEAAVSAAEAATLAAMMVTAQDEAVAYLIGLGEDTTGALAETPYVWPLARYGKVIPGADHTALLQAAAAEATAVQTATPWGPGIKIVVPPGSEINVSGTIPIDGALNIDLQGSTIVDTRVAGSTPIFETDVVRGGQITLVNGMVETNNTVIAAVATTSDLFTRANTVTVKNLIVKTYNDGLKATYFSFRSVDRLDIDNVICYDGNICLSVHGNPTLTPGYRTNTQLNVRNFMVFQCRLGASLANVDKMRLNMDCSNVGSGILVTAFTHRIVLDRCHVELFGHPNYEYAARNGVGIGIAIDGGNVDTVLQSCRVTLHSDNAVAGIQMYGVTPTTVAPSNLSAYDTLVSQSAVTTYKSLDLRGPVNWVGQWNYDADDVKISADKWSDVQVRSTSRAAPQSGNLLNYSRMSDPDQLTASPGAVAIAADNLTNGEITDGRLITLTSTTGTAAAFSTAAVSSGWHTLILNGYATTDDFYVFVGMNASPFTNFLAYRIRGYAGAQVYRLPFFVPAAQTVRVGVTAFSNGPSSGVIGRIELHRGHVNEMSDDVRVSYRATNTLPDKGIYERGDVVWNKVPVAGGAPGWMCITAPNTFKAMANLSA